VRTTAHFPATLSWPRNPPEYFPERIRIVIAQIIADAVSAFEDIELGAMGQVGGIG
jgi:hypothetical protein